MEYKKLDINIGFTLPVETEVPTLPLTLLPSMSLAVLRLLESHQAAIDVAVGETLISDPSLQMRFENLHP